MKRTLVLIAFIILAGCLVFPYEVVAQEAKDGVQPSEFRWPKQIRVDNGRDQQPVVTIPKNWHFVGVSNGEHANCNTLWFQDSNGDIYMVQGFFSYDEFLLKSYIYKLSVGSGPGAVQGK